MTNVKSQSVMLDKRLFHRDSFLRSEYAHELIDALSRGHDIAREEARIVGRWLLTDKEAVNRWQGLELLSYVGVLADYASVVRMLSDENDFVVASALSALADIGKKRAYNRIKRYLKNQNPYVRRYTYIALLDSNPELAKVDLSAVSEADLLARVGLVSALAQLGNSDSIEELRVLSRSPDRHVSSPASEALKNIESNCN